MHSIFSSMALFSFILAGCTSTDTPEGGETYGQQISKQTETMSKNIGSRSVQRNMNKVGNAALKKGDSLLGKLGL